MTIPSPALARPGRAAQIAHTARDRLAKLHLVAAGCGITTVPAALTSAAPAGVRILPVRGNPRTVSGAQARGAVFRPGVAPPVTGHRASPRASRRR